MTETKIILARELPINFGDEKITQAFYEMVANVVDKACEMQRMDCAMAISTMKNAEKFGRDVEPLIDTILKTKVKVYTIWEKM